MNGHAVWYGPAIQEAALSGDVGKMREVATQVEEYLAEAGDLPAALELLKLEIAKLEGKTYHREK